MAGREMSKFAFALSTALALILGLTTCDDRSGDAVISDPIKYDPDAQTGQVLPFKVVSAIRNFGFGEDHLAAQISISVEGGRPSDWMATGIFVAEHSIVNGVRNVAKLK